MDPRVADLLDALLGDGPAVVLADEPGKPPVVHQLQVVADPPLAERHAVFLHAPGNETGTHRFRRFVEDPEDEEDLLLDILDIENLFIGIGNPLPMHLTWRKPAVNKKIFLENHETTGAV